MMLSTGYTEAKEMKKAKARTIKKYGSDIDELVRKIRKWMTEEADAPGSEEILRKCEDVLD